MTWVKIETCTPDKPEVFSIAEKLGIDPDAVLGKLVRIWIWADQHTTDGNARSVTRSLLDRLANVTGFAEAMISSGWLTATGDGVQFVNFARHNGQTAKTRALTAERVAKSRLRNATVTIEKPQGNCQSVTESLPEKIREDKNIETQIVSGERKKRRCTSVQDDQFDDFWKIYPRRTMKGKARKAWSKALVKVDSEMILVAADRYAKQQRGKDQQFIPHPATWLNGEGWEDETLKPKDPFWYLTLPPDEREAFIRAEMAKP